MASPSRWARIVPVRAVVFFAMSNDRLDAGAPFELSPDSGCDAALLALGVNLELVLLRGVVALVSGIGEDAGKGCAGHRFDAGKDGLERMPIIGVSWQSLGVEDELTAL